MADLVIRISGKVDDFEKALDKVQDKTEALEGKLSSVAKISAVAFAALTGEVMLAVKAFGESEEVSRKLALAMQNQGIYSKALEEQYGATAEAIQNLTGIDDDAIKSGMAMIQGMAGQTEISRELTQAIVDLSAKDGNLEAAFDAVGRALQGNVKGMKSYGITIDDSLSKQERMEKIIEVVNQRLGGQAEAANKGIGGIKGLQTAFGNLQEELGARFAPAISSAIKSLTSFFDGIRQNQALIGFISDNIKLGIVLAGVSLSLATAGLAFLKMRQAIEASSIAMKIFGTSSKAALITSGIGIAVIALGEAFVYFSNKAEAGSQKAAKAIVDHSDSIKRLKSEIEGLQKSMPDTGGKPSYQVDYRTQQMAASMKAQLEMKRKQLEEEEKLQTEFDQNKSRKSTGDAAAQEAAAAEKRKSDLLRAQNDLARLESEQASSDMIALKKQEADVLAKIEDDKYQGIRDQLQARLQEIKQLEVDQHFVEIEQKKTFNDEILAQNEEFQAMSEEQKANFLAQNQAGLQAQILTEQTARDEAAKTRAQQQIAANNKFLIEQQKYGTAYATINQAMHSEIYQGTKSAFSEMAQMQTSNNSTLKAIGKVASIANIVIKTGESAMNIFAGFSTIPFVGPALGTAGAAAAIAFGAEQIGRVTAAAEGGLITGGIPGVDSVPLLAQHGELVSPRSNFEEVIGSVRAQREAQRLMGNGESSTGGNSSWTIELILGLKDNLFEVIEAGLVERQNLKLSIQRV